MGTRQYEATLTIFDVTGKRKMVSKLEHLEVDEFGQLEVGERTLDSQVQCEIFEYENGLEDEDDE